MDFQSILLALFISAIVYHIIRALYRPMLENFLRLLCIPIAFIITYMIQALGVFQLIVNRALSLFEVQSILGGFADLYGYISATITTLFAPVFFIGIYSVLLFVLNKVHVKLIIKYINSRNKKRAIREFKKTVREEKERALARVWEAEEKIDKYREENDMKVGDAYDYDDLPDEDEIEDMVERKVGFEKIKLSLKGFFFESPEKKAISIICAAVSGFLSLGIMLMPVFYTMNLATIVTDAAAQTEAENSKVYKLIQVVDKHVVSKYEDTFVVELYDSMGMVDLMVNTVRTSGYFTLDNQKVYPHDVNKHFVKYGIRVGIDATDPTSKHETLGEDVRQLTMHPLMISIATDGIVYVLNSGLVDQYLPTDGSNPMTAIPAELIGFYKNAEDPKAVVRGDVVAIGDTVVVLIESGLVTDIIAGNVSMDTITQDPTLLKEVVGAMSGLSAFPVVMESVFEMGVDMLAGFLQIPADDQAAYEDYKDDLYNAVMKNDGKVYDMEAIERFVKYAANTGMKITRIKEYGVDDVDGLAKLDRAIFTAYTTHWSNIQNVFAHAGEDTSAGNFTIEFDGITYMLTDDQTIVQVIEASANYSKVSPVSSLINYIVQNSGVEFTDTTEIFKLVALYPMSADDYSVAQNFVSGDNFVSKAVTIEGLKASMNFDPEVWKGDVRKQDCEKCIDIITSLLGFIGGGLPVDDSSDSAMGMIDMLPALGKTFDLMADTTCLKELPPQLLEGFLNNDMMSSFIPAKYVHQINEEVASNPDISYETYLRSWVDTFKLLLGFGGIV